MALVALVATTGTLALGGCGQYYWVKPGSTREQFDTDSTACAKQATASPAAAPSVEQETYRNCLTARGYAREKAMTKPESGHRGIEHYD
jgi:hypothetical protein